MTNDLLTFAQKIIEPSQFLAHEMQWNSAVHSKTKMNGSLLQQNCPNNVQHWPKLFQQQTHCTFCKRILDASVGMCELLDKSIEFFERKKWLFSDIDPVP